MNTIDRLATDLVHGSKRTGGLLEYIIAIFALSFNNEIVAFLYTFALVIIPFSVKDFILCIFLPLFNLLVTVTLKRKISRPRPLLNILRFRSLVFDFRGREKNHSMPSGDSTQSAAYWTLLAYFNIISYYHAGILILLTMSARIYYMCHYPSDTVVGAAIGICNFFILKEVLGFI